MPSEFCVQYVICRLSYDKHCFLKMVLVFFHCCFISCQVENLLSDKTGNERPYQCFMGWICLAFLHTHTVTHCDPLFALLNPHIRFFSELLPKLSDPSPFTSSCFCLSVVLCYSTLCSVILSSVHLVPVFLSSTSVSMPHLRKQWRISC